MSVCVCVCVSVCWLARAPLTWKGKGKRGEGTWRRKSRGSGPRFTLFFVTFPIPFLSHAFLPTGMSRWETASSAVGRGRTQRSTAGSILSHLRLAVLGGERFLFWDGSGVKRGCWLLLSVDRWRAEMILPGRLAFVVPGPSVH
ncbi:hypothetical protein B0I37DRAFT_359713 [Chaetomium sp. MPI-CAGE-AT-0009]|nr:hypothetical protein B0I37DRAFT_359713 [Chaetomium sp. MPI-CAGE-AT-0009]